MKTKTKNRVGRSSKIKKIDMNLACKLYKAGLTEEQISAILGVSVRTIEREKKKNKQFCRTIKDWKSEHDDKVEHSLARKAKGYEYEEVTRELVNKKMTITKRVIKHVPASDTSIIFWLTNRKHGDWRRTREAEGKDPLSVAVYNLIKQQDSKKKPGKRGKITVDSSVKIQRGGLKIVN